jgi:MFS family permease
VFGRRSHSDDDVEPVATGPTYHHESARERYGGFSFAAAFYGWLVAVALTVLLAGILGAAAAATGSTLNFTPSDAEREAGTVGLATGVALLAILLIGYFAGGYVAGRMSRFDGGRQGLGVWLIGLLVTILVAVLGAVFGTQYDIFQRVSLPSMPIPTEALTFGGVIALVAVVVVTLLAAMIGGKAGQRYHTKVDRAAIV